MREKPILFNGPMVRAILEGRKTQTRRMMKPQPLTDITIGKYRYYGEVEGIHYLMTLERTPRYERHIACGKPPYLPGDRIWVRETWAAYHHIAGGKVLYEADGEDYLDSDHLTVPHEFIKWRPSIHMPRAASRITLEVTDVRAEQVQDISDQDAIAEGILSDGFESVLLPGVPRLEYEMLWEDIYGPGSWESNPWVWVICFKVLEVKK